MKHVFAQESGGGVMLIDEVYQWLDYFKDRPDDMRNPVCNDAERLMRRLAEFNADLLDALRAVVGHGYTEVRHPASQDYVSKRAISQVRSAIAKAEASGH